MPKGQRKYSQEFKEQAISLVTERGYTHAEAAKDLGVSLHTLKSWLKAARKNGAGQITPEGEEYHTRSHGIYGYRKVAEDVRREAGISCCNETVRVLMKERGLCAKTRRKFVRTTVSDDTHPHAENILNRAFSAGEANQKWTADITYIATAEGWLYLAAVMDLYSRRIVGWSMSESIDAGLVCRALQAAYELRRPAHHSDRDVQYTLPRINLFWRDTG